MNTTPKRIRPVAAMSTSRAAYFAQQRERIDAILLEHKMKEQKKRIRQLKRLQETKKFTKIRKTSAELKEEIMKNPDYPKVVVKSLKFDTQPKKISKPNDIPPIIVLSDDSSNDTVFLPDDDKGEKREETAEEIDARIFSFPSLASLMKSPNHDAEDDKDDSFPTWASIMEKAVVEKNANLADVAVDTALAEEEELGVVECEMVIEEKIKQPRESQVRVDDESFPTWASIMEKAIEQRNENLVDVAINLANREAEEPAEEPNPDAEEPEEEQVVENLVDVAVNVGNRDAEEPAEEPNRYAEEPEEEQVFSQEF